MKKMNYRTRQLSPLRSLTRPTARFWAPDGHSYTLIISFLRRAKPFATASAKEDDETVAAVYRKAGAKVIDMDQAVVDRWRKIAENAAWTDFAKRSADCERFLKMAKAVA